MKALLFSIATTAMMLAGVSCASVKTAPETVTGVTKQVATKDFAIDVRMANPMRGKSIILNSRYELRIKGDSAYAYLPYYGVAQWAPYGNTDGGIKFDEPMRGYTIIPNRKGNGWNIRFKVNAKDYGYDISLSIFNNQNATITVSSTNRDMITFSGEVVST